ncbi:MAG: bifunctional enzyme CysN/CysC [Solirubrobacteraceae bacterium]|nr:bifunctional enzyme CysN/CysC [Solirubrobacteraceae bacterium]
MSLDLLRFTTAGSVDDGKSTLIGRILYDSKQVFADQLAHISDASLRRGGEGVLDLALLTDGLRAEREQGITIDVAYRYFATPRRRFIIADCPGHQQYTRNMVTGASTADLAVVLLDARKGTVEQSKRHAFISALLGIPHLVVAVNKMDLVNYSADRFAHLVEEFAGFAEKLGVADVTYIPISALCGDNVVERSDRLDWHAGPTLLGYLEEVEVSYDHPDEVPARFPVQWVVKPAVGDYRGYAGQLASGALRTGDEVVVLPGGRRTRIAAIDTFDGELDEAVAPLSVTLRLEDELDVARGELICHPDGAPAVGRELEADLCWMGETPLRAGRRYAIKHTSRNATAVVDTLHDRVDVHTLARDPGPAELALNDIGRVSLRTSAPLAFDAYRANRRTGSFILIDETTNATVAAGMVAGP